MALLGCMWPYEGEKREGKPPGIVKTWTVGLSTDQNARSRARECEVHAVGSTDQRTSPPQASGRVGRAELGPHRCPEGREGTGHKVVETWHYAQPLPLVNFNSLNLMGPSQWKTRSECLLHSPEAGSSVRTPSRGSGTGKPQVASVLPCLAGPRSPDGETAKG